MRTPLSSDRSPDDDAATEARQAREHGFPEPPAAPQWLPGTGPLQSVTWRSPSGEVRLERRSDWHGEYAWLTDSEGSRVTRVGGLHMLDPPEAARRRGPAPSAVDLATIGLDPPVATATVVR